MNAMDSSLSAELESLLDERRQLTDRKAHILAQFGQTGTHSLQKEILKAEIAREFQDRRLEEGEGLTPELRVNEAVANDPRFRSFCEQVIRDRVEWFRVTEQRDSITFRIRFLLQKVCSDSNV